MPTGSSGYPGVIDVFEAIKAEAELVGPDVVDHAAALNAIEAELGINPSGASATVVERLDAITAALGVPNDGSVTLAKLAAALKPSGSAGATDEAVRRLGTGATHATAGDDARLPTPGQKNALGGSHGTPGTGNEYLTKQGLGAAGDAGKALAADDATFTGLDPRLDDAEASLLAVESRYAYDPEPILVGDLSDRDAEGLLLSAPAVWPDGDAGTYTVTDSSEFGVLAYTITKGVLTFTQPAMTRDSNGAVITRPAITVA